MPLVIDSSVAASWGIPDESSPTAADALELVEKVPCEAPSIFWHELRNVLLVSERRGRLTVEETQRALSLVDDVDPTIDSLASHESVMRLARKHSLTAYDAAYLELALRLGAPLATLDRRLAQAARNEGVTLVEAAAS